MLHIEHRQMRRSNGLIDDFVLYGTPSDYLFFAVQVEEALRTSSPVSLATASLIRIEILKANDENSLFTSLQNEDDFYPSMDAWAGRMILRLRGTGAVLESLRRFLLDFSGRGDGYSYISEYSNELAYCAESPQWRLHVQTA